MTPKILFLLATLMFLTACDTSSSQAPAVPLIPDAGSDTALLDRDVDFAQDVSTAPDIEGEGQQAGTLHVRPVYHPVLPPGHEVPGATTYPILRSATSTTIRLPAGVFKLDFDATPDEGTELPLSPVAGAHGRENLSGQLFFLPQPEEFQLSLAGDELLLTRIDEGSHASLSQLFDAAIEAAGNNLEDVAPVETLQHALRESGIFPAHSDSLGHLFIAIGSEDGVPPEMRGSFNGWTRQERFEFRPLIGRLWARFVTGIEGHQAYKIVYGDGASWFTDMANPHIDWDGIDSGTVGLFNSILNVAERPPGQGRLLWLPRVYSPELENTREAYIYLPSSYDEGDTEYPLLVVHDGNESITRGRFHQVAYDFDVVLAFIALPSQDLRMSEYTVATEGSRGEDHARFLVDTLLPELRTRYRLSPNPRHNGVAGASLGGLMSFWTAVHHPQTFGFAGGMSSSFFWADEHIFEVLETQNCQDVVFYLDSGSPADNHGVTLAMRDRLTDLECTYTHRVEEGGRHEWGFWNGRFGHLLETFLAP